MKKVSNILWGILLIVVGVIWALNSTGVANINIFFRGWWTLFIIVPSIIGIVENPKDSSGYIFLAVGVFLLLGARDIISFALIAKLILPIILILIGVSVIFKDTINGKVSKKIAEIDKDGTEIYTATFSDNKVKLSGDVFKNGVGSTVLKAVVYQAGVEVDAAGSGTYTWTKYNKDGAIDTSWGTSGKKTGKTLSVSSSDVATKATFMVEVVI